MLLKFIFDALTTLSQPPKVERVVGKLEKITYSALLSFLPEGENKPSIELFSEKAELNNYLLKNKIMEVELKSKALYLYFISNFTDFIFYNINSLYPDVQDSEAKLLIAETYFLKNFPHYIPNTFEKISEGDVTTLVRYSAKNLKNLLDKLVLNYWQALFEKHKKMKDPSQTYTKMLATFSDCLNLPHFEDYAYNLLTPMFLIQCKEDQDNNAVLKQAIADTEKRAKELSESTVETLVFDFPKRRTLIDTIKTNWEKRNATCTFFNNEYFEFREEKDMTDSEQAMNAGLKLVKTAPGSNLNFN